MNRIPMNSNKINLQSIGILSVVSGTSAGNFSYISSQDHRSYDTDNWGWRCDAINLLKKIYIQQHKCKEVLKDMSSRAFILQFFETIL